jgi:cytosine/adenosine deaminase-related metal-dependent hydrolase
VNDDQVTVRNIAISRATLVLPDGIRTSPLYVANGRVASTCPPGHVSELELPDHLVFPGLINAHDHLHLNSIPPLPQRPPFRNSYAWIAAYQLHLASSAVTAATSITAERRCYHGGLKNLFAGATTVLHHDPWKACLGDPAFPVRVLQHFGWSHSLGMGLEMVRPKELPRYGPPVAESFAATPADEPWIIHLAEGTDELAAGELSRLDALGCLAPNTVLVHGVGLSEPDIELLLARGAAIIWCPSSNLAILGRTLEPRRLFDAGRLALGTDSRLSGVHDLLTELRVAAAHSDLTACELFRLVTAQASRVLRAPCAGGFGAGQHADLLVLRDRGSDPYEQLLAATRGELRAVLRDGVPAIADPEFAGWFAAFGLKVMHVKLDGHDKLLARARLGSFTPESLPVEPGLEWRAA